MGWHVLCLPCHRVSRSWGQPVVLRKYVEEVGICEREQEEAGCGISCEREGCRKFAPQALPGCPPSLIHALPPSSAAAAVESYVGGGMHRPTSAYTYTTSFAESPRIEPTWSMVPPMHSTFSSHNAPSCTALSKSSPCNAQTSTSAAEQGPSSRLKILDGANRRHNSSRTSAKAAKHQCVHGLRGHLIPSPTIMPLPTQHHTHAYTQCTQTSTKSNHSLTMQPTSHQRKLLVIEKVKVVNSCSAIAVLVTAGKQP